MFREIKSFITLFKNLLLFNSQFLFCLVVSCTLLNLRKGYTGTRPFIRINEVETILKSF